MAKLQDLTGQKFGRWTVVRRAKDRIYGSSPKRLVAWTCICDCGRESEVLAYSLRHKKKPSRSCGCLAVEQTKVRNKKEGTAFRDLLALYKASARVRGVVFDLSASQAHDLFVMPCYYCGQEPNKKRVKTTGETYIHGGIDRLDSSLGYSVWNTVACCSQCNKMKQSFSRDSFIDKCKQIAGYHA